MHPEHVGHRCGDLVQQMRAISGERPDPTVQRLVDVVLCSRSLEVESDLSESLDFLGREP